MNAAAFAECAAQWRRLQAAHSSGGLAADETASWRRVSNRPELRLVLEPPERVRKMPPGSFGAMGLVEGWAGGGWADLGGWVDGEARAARVLPSGHLVVVGAFRRIGGVTSPPGPRRARPHS